MAVKLYIGNLPPMLCFPELEDLFTPFGSLQSAELITDPATGLSRGFGFIEMETETAAQAAISDLNGKEVDGQSLTVNEVKPGRGGPSPIRDSGRGRPSPVANRPPSQPRQPSGTRLFVGNLPYSAGNTDLEKVFAEVGTVSSVSVVTDRFSGQSKGFAFVEMGSKEEADAIIEKFNGQEVLGRVLKVNAARPPERRRFGGGGGGGRRF